MSLKSSLNAICDTALDAVVAVDSRGQIVGFNAEAEELFGYTCAEAEGQPMAELIVPERYRAAHHAGMKRFLETGERKLIGGKVEIEALHRDGHDVPVELGLSILQLDGKTIFLSFLRDLSERRMREEEIRSARDRAEKANAAKSFVVSMVAHDMRNALGGVIGNLALLDRHRLTQEEQEIFGGIEDGARSLRRLLSDTLDLARLEAGEIEVSAAPLLIEDFIAEISQAWETRLAKADVTMSIEIAKDAPRRVMLDEFRLRQIVSNLISNAVKYAPGTKLALTIEPQGLNGLRITVADQGQGFSDAALETAFDPFVRPTGQSSDGSGLGLAIVKTITEAMDGHIELNSTPDKGAQIVVGFNECRLEAPLPSEPMPQHFDGTAVLLVEDNATNRLVAAKMLEKIGCDVSLCEDGLSGVETAEKIGFDAIFMDIDLPKLNGKDAIRRLRSGDGPNALAPIIAFTAFAIRSQREEILASGANSILTKPVSGPDGFAKVLGGVLGSTRQPPPNQKVDDKKVVDFDRLTGLRDTLGSEDFEILSEEFRKDMQGILTSVADENRTDESLRRATHIAISLTGTLGATSAQQAAENLNSAAHNGLNEKTEACRCAFETVLRDTIAAFDDFLEAS